MTIPAGKVVRKEWTRAAPALLLFALSQPMPLYKPRDSFGTREGAMRFLKNKPSRLAEEAGFAARVEAVTSRGQREATSWPPLEEPLTEPTRQKLFWSPDELVPESGRE